MPNTNTNILVGRNDTILGVCEAIGRDFGFNPIWLRLAFIAPLFFAPSLTIAAYFGLGLLVGAVNYFSPDKQLDQPHLVSSNSVAKTDADEGMAIAA